MALWVQYILAGAAVVTALGILWQKVLRPGAKLITTTDEMLPLLKDLSKAFHGTPHAFEVLDQIVAQFRTDSGSSLRDVVNRLDAAAIENKSSNDLLKVWIETLRETAVQDRQQLMRVIRLIDQVAFKVDTGAATAARIEQHAGAVANDLAEAHKRADEHTSGVAGEAADAAAQQTRKEKLENAGGNEQ